MLCFYRLDIKCKPKGTGFSFSSRHFFSSCPSQPLVKANSAETVESRAGTHQVSTSLLRLGDISSPGAYFPGGMITHFHGPCLTLLHALIQIPQERFCHSGLSCPDSLFSVLHQPVKKWTHNQSYCWGDPRHTHLTHR